MRPSDIPEDVWDAAWGVEAWARPHYAPDTDEQDKLGVVIAIARELMTVQEEAEQRERERCAQRTPDFVYDDNEWEFTASWDHRDLVVDGAPLNEVLEVCTLHKGPPKYAVWVADENGTELHWCDTADEAQALIPPAQEIRKGTL